VCGLSFAVKEQRDQNKQMKQTLVKNLAYLKRTVGAQGTMKKKNKGKKDFEKMVWSPPVFHFRWSVGGPLNLFFFFLISC